MVQGVNTCAYRPVTPNRSRIYNITSFFYICPADLEYSFTESFNSYYNTNTILEFICIRA